MKNIHILPTDKPSRLFNDGIDLYLSDLMDRQGHPVTSYNIYTTSDEEIKEGDWFISIPRGTIHKCTGIFENNLIDNTWENREKVEITKADCKKIILTTDPDLIADGVQAIDDEFLEWFVKNSSCEYVEVKQKQHFEPNKTKRVNPLNGVYYSYKIIIPQEEPKALTKLEIAKNIAAIGIGKEKPKQETLEEAAERIIIEYVGNEMSRDDKRLYAMLKAVTDKLISWQSERMYSEEEFLELLPKFAAYTLINADEETRLPLKEWFDQFGKNKMKELSKGKEVLLKIHQDKAKRMNPCQAHNENNDNMDINIENNYG
jgi:hypothetical protein